MTLKSRSDMYMNNDTNDTNGMDSLDRKEMIEKRRDEEQFGGGQIQENQTKKKKL